jgi:hypothetical protein
LTGVLPTRVDGNILKCLEYRFAVSSHEFDQVFSGAPHFKEYQPEFAFLAS